MKKTCNLMVFVRGIALIVAALAFMPIHAAASYANKDTDGNGITWDMLDSYGWDIVNEPCPSTVSLNGFWFNSSSEVENMVIPKSLGWYSNGEDNELLGTPQVNGIKSVCFRNFTRVKTVTIPWTLEWVELPAFWGCSNLSSFILSGADWQQTHFAVEDGVLYNKDKTKLIKYPEGKTDRFFVVPETVTELAPYCFANTKLIAVQFQGNCPTVDTTSFKGSKCVAYRFDDTSGWPEGSYGWNGYWSEAGIAVSSLPRNGERTFENSVYMYEIIDGVLFRYGIQEDRATLDFDYRQGACIPKAILGAASIPSAFRGFFLTSIGRDAFDGCSGLTSISIPNSVTSIGHSMFSGCSGLTSITVDSGNSSYDSRNGCNAIIETSSNTLIAGCKSTVIPDSVTSIGDYAFDGCSGLTSISIPDSVTSIGSGVFWGCDGLTSVTIPDSVTSIGEGAVAYCYRLTSITVDSGNSSYDSRNGCNAIIETTSNTLIAGCESTVIPDSVTSIGNGAFWGCSGLTSITIPDSVTSIGEDAFSVCFGLTSITVDSGNSSYDSRNGCNAIIETTSNTLIVGCKSTVIPDSVTSIGNGAFGHCYDLTSITIPNSVTSIGNFAFGHCYDLTSITIPDSVTSIGETAFYDCYKLTSITIPDSVTSIGPMAFESPNFYSQMTSIRLPYVFKNSVDSLGLPKDCEVVLGDCMPLAITTDDSLPIGLTDILYKLQLDVTGGAAPYTCEIVDEDNWPTWLDHDFTRWGDMLVLGDSSFSSGWPSEDDIGTYTFALRVTDAEGSSVERTFTLEVQEDPNHAPEIEMWAPNVNRFRLDPGATTNLSVVASDPDGDELTYSWSIHDENWSWWESGDSTNAVYAFSRSVGQEGTNIVEVCVSDGLRAAYHSWTVLVQEKTPLSIETDAALPVAYTDVSYWQPLVVSGGEWPYTWEIVDEDDWPEWLWADCITNWVDAGYADPCFREYWYPSEDDIGTYAFALRVTDAEGTSVERTFTLEVQENPNHAPEIESWTPEAARFRLDPGATTNLSVVASDPDGDELTYSWSIYDENWDCLESGVSTNATYAFSRIVGDEGLYNVQVWVSDGSRANDHFWTILVQEKTPLAIVTDAALPVAYTDVSYWQSLVVSGGEWPYTWGIVDEDDWPEWLDREYIDDWDKWGYSSPYLSGTPYEDDIGTYSFALRVTDAEGTSVERTFTLEVQEDPNHAPVIESRSPESYSVAIREGASAFFSIEASDPDGDEIEIAWSLCDGDGNWIADLATNAQGRVEFSQSEGAYQVSAYASDGSRHANAWWNVNVVAADAPMIDTDLPHAVEGVDYETQLAATGGTAPYTWSENYWAVELSEDGLLVFDTDGWGGTEDFTTASFEVTVTDAAGRSTTQTLTLVIERNPNERPAIDFFTPEWDDYDDFALTPIGVPIVFSVEAHDPEGEPLTFEWELDDEPLETTGPSWTWTPGAADRGRHELGVRCSDGERESWWQYWYFDVVSTNVLRPVVDLPVATVGEPYAAALSVSDGTEPYVWGGPEYAMSREANSFAETGVAQDWAKDDGCWSVSLPFSFPFYGETYDTIWISDNGTICLDGEFSKWEFDEDKFKSHALIAPLWTDLDGSIQVIYVDSSVSGQVTIRWAAHYYDDEADDPVVAFSATLCADGEIRFAYGDEAQAGAVGISAGDGARFLLPGELRGADLGSGDDIVLRPSTFAPGMVLAANGTVAGTPTTAGTYCIPVTVVDAEGASWSGTTDLYVIEADADVTRTTPVPVPHSWLAGYGLGDGTSSGYEAAALAAAANGRPVWACYVADLDPTDEDDDLVANIEMVDGEPEITILKGESADRVYETQGAPAPGGPWGERTGNSRFFRIKASLPTSP